MLAERGRIGRGRCGVRTARAQPARGATEAHRIGDAAERGDVDAVRALIKQHVDVNAPSADGTPALHWIVRMQDVETRASPPQGRRRRRSKQSLRRAPLHLAINNGDVPMVKLLLAARAGRELVGRHGRELPDDGGARAATSRSSKRCSKSERP